MCGKQAGYKLSCGKGVKYENEGKNIMPVCNTCNYYGASFCNNRNVPVFFRHVFRNKGKP